MFAAGSMVLLLCTAQAGEAGPTFSVERGVRQLIVVSALCAAAIEVPFGREVQIVEGRLQDRFEGFETHVYLLAR